MVHTDKTGEETSFTQKLLVYVTNNYKEMQIIQIIKCEILKQKNWNSIFS